MDLAKALRLVFSAGKRDQDVVEFIAFDVCLRGLDTKLTVFFIEEIGRAHV